MTAQVISGRTTPEEACEALGIKKSPYYQRLRFLNIKAHKDDEGKGTYLTEDQMKLMWDLHEHIKQTGKMEGFSGGGQLALVESSGAPALEIPLEPETFGDGDDGELDQIIWEAAELKKQRLAKAALIRLHLAHQMTEDDLPDEMKEELAAVREAANLASPKQNPAAAASNLLAKYRATRSGGN
jgi:hypothetical protein